jgi:hypothetical protein
LENLSMTYPMVTPYLKGLHLTLALYHLGRNKFGWKMAVKEWVFYLHEAVEYGKFSDAEAQLMTQASLEPTTQNFQEGESFTSPVHPGEWKPLPHPPS